MPQKGKIAFDVYVYSTDGETTNLGFECDRPADCPAVPALATENALNLARRERVTDHVDLDDADRMKAGAVVTDYTGRVLSFSWTWQPNHNIPVCNRCGHALEGVGVEPGQLAASGSNRTVYVYCKQCAPNQPRSGEDINLILPRN